MEFTKAQFGAWKEHPVTVEVWRELRRRRRLLRRALLQGACLDLESSEKTGLGYLRTWVEMDSLEQLISLNFEEIEQGEPNENEA